MKTHVQKDQSRLVQKSEALAVLVSFTAFVALSSCGRSDVVYPGESAAVVTTQATPAPTPTPLPNGFTDLSVNQASVAVVTVNGSKRLQLKTSSAAQTAGAYNDASATGNRAIVGFSVGTQQWLSSGFSGISVSMEQTAGSSDVSILLNIETDCAHPSTSTHYLLTTDATAFDATASSDSAGFYWYDAGVTDAVWLVRGTHGIPDPNPANPDVLNPSKVSTPHPMSLSALMNKYPDACLVESVSADNGLPKNTTVPGAMLAIGSENTSSVNTLLIKQIYVGNALYNDWSQP